MNKYTIALIIALLIIIVVVFVFHVSIETVFYFALSLYAGAELIAKLFKL